jgi:hypothetical protein
MGFHYSILDYKTPFDYVEDVKYSEGCQLDHFVNFILYTGLNDELKEKRWADFAKIYNGAGYKKNKYDEKLAKAYEEYNVQVVD